MAPSRGTGLRPAAARTPQRGLVLIALLILLVLVGVGALGAAEVWSTQRKREREVELLFVGNQYRHAIESYYKAPAARHILPNSVEQLLNDDRFPNPVHHLRRAYRDPVDEEEDWELIKVNNALVGVHSRSEAEPIKRAGFAPPYQQFEKAETYAQWQFVFLPNMPNGSALGGTAAPGMPNAPPTPSTPGQQGAPGVPVPGWGNTLRP